MRATTQLRAIEESKSRTDRAVEMTSIVSVSLLLGLLCGLETFGAEFGKFSDINITTTKVEIRW